MECPLVSFCIFTYNQENFIEEAIEGAIKQDYPNLEIIISDDNSTDRTFEVINKTVNKFKNSCKHDIIINKNHVNLGIREHCNKVLYEIAKGDILLLAGGDDISLPERTSESVKYFNLYPDVKSLSFSSKLVDVNLQPLKDMNTKIISGEFSLFTLEDYISFRDFIIFSGDSRALRREVIEKFPPLKYSKSEDIYLFVRSLILGSIVYIRKPLVLRRVHGNNVSFGKFPKSLIINMQKQFQFDLSYAYEKKYIDKDVYYQLNNKIKHIINLEKKMYYREQYPIINYMYKFLKKIVK